MSTLSKTTKEQFVKLGEITGFYGVKGWVKLFSYSRPRDGLCTYKKFLLSQSEHAESVVFTKIKASGKYIVGHIQGVDSREQAQQFLGQSLFLNKDDLPQLKDEYYWYQLIGLQVFNQDEQYLGDIVEMMETGANDVMVIKNQSNEETLIPYACSHFVKSVDLEKAVMKVDWEVE